MNKPLRAKPPAARPVARGQAQTDQWVRDDRWSLITAAMVWLLIVYLVVPSSYWTGSAPVSTAAAMAEGNVAARAIKLGLITLSSLVLLWRASLAMLLLRTLNPFFLVFLALVPLSILWSIDPSATTNRYGSVLSITLTSLAFVLIGWHQARFQD